MFRYGRGLHAQLTKFMMYLLVGLRSAWKCVEVSLQDGCVPVISGVALPNCNIEPALWFKVELAPSRGL